MQQCQIILVPQGAEYKAVCRGLSRITTTKPVVLPIPVGPDPLARHLKKLQQAGHFLNDRQSQVLLMGLCGSLSPNYGVGDIVFYQGCAYKSNASTCLFESCDRELTTLLQRQLKQKVSEVKALTSDRLIWSAAEKRQLNSIYDADVVDMEGFAALKVLSEAGIAVAMVRVVSDDCHHNLPDLTSAISSDGSLQPFPLALRLLRHPLASTQLISGALRGLRVLQRVTTCLAN